MKQAFSIRRLPQRAIQLVARRRMARITRQVALHAPPSGSQAPVVVFNASTRIGDMSLNAAFSLLTAWGLRMAGVPVIHFVCQRGMEHCVLGVNRQDYHQPPPCARCQAQSGRLYAHADVHAFEYVEHSELAGALQGLGVAELSCFSFPASHLGLESGDIPLGALVLPSLRWTLRQHTLPDDEPVRYLLRSFILSAFQVMRAFAALLRQSRPQAAVFFNGLMYPEASARWVARQMGVRTVAHEVGFRPFSAFFSEGEPTAYPIAIPQSFELSPAQNEQLDAYLEKRFEGQFSMAGIHFWPEMRRLDPEFLARAAQFKQIVPLFTNVIYDTSQVHANTIFEHMFAWLDRMLPIIRSHPETLFVIRAHPDEMRPNSAKQSRESVRDWVKNHRLDELANVTFIDSQEYLSSYELIQRSKMVMVYNSSIGLEASILGVPVLCGGKARYTQYPTVFLPGSPEEFERMAEEMLSSAEIQTPPEFQRNARRFLYYQLFRASLPFGDYLENAPRMGYVQLRPFKWQLLQSAASPALQIVIDGILHRQPFLLPGES